jgi:hypothetical protein
MPPIETVVTGPVPSVSTFARDAGNSGTTKTIDWRLAVFQKVTMTGNCTFTFNDPQSGVTYGLSLVQDATGSRTATWPANVTWEGGTAPTLTTTAAAKDIVIFLYDSVDDVYYGSYLLDMS